MPTIICNETKPSTYDGGYKINDRRFGFSKKEFQTVYQIQADNANQNEDDILATVGLPPLWLFLRNAYCVSRKAKEVNTQALLWEVVCNFTSEINPENADNTDPESAAPQWTWGMETETRERKKDVDGKLIQNTAGESIAYEGPVVVPILTITRFQAVFDPLTIVNYCNHVNTTTFWGVPPGSALCSGISDAQESINDVNYRKVTYTFKVRIDPETGTLRSDAWQLELLNEGQMELIPTADMPLTECPDAKDQYDGKCRVRAVDGKQKPIKVNLKIDGTRETSTLDTDVVWLPFKVYDDAEFNTLNLGPF